MRGRFIVLEGVDGTGKTTLAGRLADMIGDAAVTSEPTTGRIGAVLRSGELGDIPPAAEALLFAADRAIHTAEMEGILESGRWVICDRYMASTVAYQSAAMGGGADIEWLIEMQRHAVIEPDATFLLDMDPEESLRRVDSRGGGTSRFEKLDFLREVRREYLRLAERFGFSVIDASADRDSVFSEVAGILKEKGLYASERRDILQ